MSARFALVTPPPSAQGGAIAVVHIDADTPDDLDAALRAASIAPVGVGEAKLRTLAGIDEGVVARVDERSAFLMPHAGPAVLDLLHAALTTACSTGTTCATGGVPAGAPQRDPRVAYPEAEDLIEACALGTIAAAASPRAIDVLANQIPLWRSGAPPCQPATGAALDHLLRPPVVAAVGPANIGKSSLLNALAGANIAVVADEPGTTRDHVGVALTLDELTVHWLDLPGVRADPDAIERDATTLALAAARRAELVVLCEDAVADDPPGPADLTRWCDANALTKARLRCRLRADRAAGPCDPAAIDTSAVTAAGLGALAARIRQRLVPDAALRTPHRWRFHPALPA